MRHSLREPITDNRNPYRAQLTDEGRDLARFFGTLLPLSRPICCFASPVQRCMETASLIAEGFRSVGGRVCRLQADPDLARLYGDSLASCLAAVETLSPEGFFAEWARQSRLAADAAADLGPRLPVGGAVMVALPEARRRLREAVLSHSYPDCLNLFVTHDYHLNILRRDFVQMEAPDYPWPPCLSGERIEPLPVAGEAMGTAGSMAFPAKTEPPAEEGEA